jgi:hypothetical protein
LPYRSVPSWCGFFLTRFDRRQKWNCCSLTCNCPPSAYQQLHVHGIHMSVLARLSRICLCACMFTIVYVYHHRCIGASV